MAASAGSIARLRAQLVTLQHVTGEDAEARALVNLGEIANAITEGALGRARVTYGA